MIDPVGEGRSTVNLVNEVAKIVARGKIIYQQVWVVFDKDDFLDFDKAISLAKRKGYKVAWSNQSFEYWIFLHFHYSDAAINRDDWETKISEIFKKKRINPDGYHKNDKNVFEIVTKNGSLSLIAKYLWILAELTVVLLKSILNIFQCLMRILSKPIFL